jgi:serine/threonine protein kinase
MEADPGSPALDVGTLIAGRYRLERHLGEGGMGTVWAATHVVTRRSVAMKFLRRAVAHKVELRARFLREAQAASALRHPNVVEVMDVFDLPDNSPVIVMELLDGETLAEKLLRDERLSMEETAAVLLPVVAAVGAAHANGIVHRDLKPENVFLARAEDGATRVKVLDFGIAKLFGEQAGASGSMLVTESGSLLGTPCYMAPEQMGNSDVDYRADVWSLGVMLYECLSGTRPIEGQNMAEVIARLIGNAIVPLDRLAPELPHDVTALVQQMLTRDPARRLQDLAELTKVLGRFARVAVPSFGPPQASDVANLPTHLQSRPSAPPTPAGVSAASIRRTTMLSAPAVGIDGRHSAVEAVTATTVSRAGRLRLVLAIAVGAVAGVLLFVFRTSTPEPLASPAAASQTPTVSVAAQSATPPSEQAPAPSAPATAERERPSAPAASAKPSRAASGAVLHNRPQPTKLPAAQNSEDTLFSGRK